MSRSRAPRRNWASQMIRLEDRMAPAVFTVTTTADNGDNITPTPGSLRAAIIEANEFPDSDTIDFALTGGNYVINPPAGLPQITAPTSIDGRTQPGYSGVPLVELRGNAVANSDGLNFLNGSGSVYGLVINQFANNYAIRMKGAANAIENCYLGVDAAGAVAKPNNGGVFLENASSCDLHNNVISGNKMVAVAVSAVSGLFGVTIAQNLIGTDYSGMSAIPNGTAGSAAIEVTGPNVTIGGSVAGLGNVISGNALSGIRGLTANNLFIRGNLIGTNKAGTAALPNGSVGVIVDTCINARVGENTAAARNVISGNGGTGVSIIDSFGAGVTGNYIGVDINGTVQLANGGAGVQLNGGLAGNSISNNVISGNAGDGIQVVGSSSATISGNYIGLYPNGTAKLGNAGHGVHLMNSQSCYVFAANYIAANAGHGVLVDFSSAGSITVSGNFIGTGKNLNELFGNGQNGIEFLGANKNVIINNMVVNSAKSGLVLRGGTTNNVVNANTISRNAEHGVLITESASTNTIGGKNPGDGNTIGTNGTTTKHHGVEIASGLGNQLRQNSIFDNKGRGIDLNNDALTLNDPDGEDSTTFGLANRLQDYPVLISRSKGAAYKGAHVWKLNSQPNEDFTIEFFSNPGLNPAEYGEGAIFISSTQVKTDALGNATVGLDTAGHNYVTTTATDKDGNTSEFAMVDTDADALPDAWELSGLDINEDGVVDLNLPGKGANPLHKDLFVEVDAMTGLDPTVTPTQADLDLVANDTVNKAGFKYAPDDLVHNPDQEDGITLHATLDDINIPAKAFGATRAQYWGDFFQIKNTTFLSGGQPGAFGSAAERADANWVQIRAAKSLVYRYGIFAQEYGTDQSSGIAERPADGSGGNDFMVTLQKGAWGGITQLDRAGTFMHEFGHTLSLQHGGDVERNFKPNYRSVMNYTWQMPNALKRTKAPGLPSYSASWRLDYSREKLTTLHEPELYESAGIGGTTVVFNVPYGQATIGANNKPRITASRLATVPGAIDWNMNGSANQDPVGKFLDVNFDGKLNTLEGHEDWSQLQFYFRETKQAVDGALGVEDDPIEDSGIEPPPVVQSVTINEGDPQRSRVNSVEIAFSQVVTLPALPETAFKLERQGGGPTIPLTAAVVDSEVFTTVTLTFTAAPAEYGSLPDGRYTLTIDADLVSNIWGNLDGNGDETGGDDFVLASQAGPNPPTNIFRQFGDINGDGFTDNVDLVAYRSANGSDSTMLNYNPAFDFNGDGFIDNVDFIEFRQRVGAPV